MQKDPYDHHDVSVLCRAFLALETEEECLRFLQDLMTIREIRDMSQRLKVAEMLKTGMPYTRIHETVPISSATISRISRCLNYGDGGYETVLNRLTPQTEGRQADEQEGNRSSGK